MIGWGDDPLDMILGSYIRLIDEPLSNELTQHDFDALYTQEELDYFTINKPNFLKDASLFPASQHARFDSFLKDEIKLNNYKHRMETIRWRDIEVVRDALVNTHRSSHTTNSSGEDAPKFQGKQTSANKLHFK
jgi:hypothetical protein